MRLIFSGKLCFPEELLVTGSLVSGPRKNVLNSLRKLNVSGHASLNGDRGLFSSSFYLLTNPDVAQARLVPWAHYQTLGRFEGRSPHPFVDLNYLSMQMGLPVAEVLDHYIRNKKFWILNPSPFVNITQFLESGSWDGIRHPLLQILEDGLVHEPWMNFRIPLIALGTGERTPELAQAFISLWGLNKYSWPGRELQVSKIVNTDFVPGLPVSGLCIPGFVVTHSGLAHLLDDSRVVSLDNSALWSNDFLVSIATGKQHEINTLHVFPHGARRECTQLILNTVSDGDALSPGSFEQESLLRYLISLRNISVEVLPYGKQSQVKFSNLILHDASHSLMSERKSVSLEELNPLTCVIVASEETITEIRLTKFATLISQGAMLCCVNRDNLWAYAPILERAESVVPVGNQKWLDLWLSQEIPYGVASRNRDSFEH